jgi:hypothetical protein
MHSHIKTQTIQTPLVKTDGRNLHGHRIRTGIAETGKGMVQGEAVGVVLRLSDKAPGKPIPSVPMTPHLRPRAA